MHLLRPSLKETFLKAPSLTFPTHKFQIPKLSGRHIARLFKVLELPTVVMGVAVKYMLYGTVFKINKYRFLAIDFDFYVSQE